MATINPRVQVTVDPELGEALAAIDPDPPSRSRLIRDLALRGARAAEEESNRREAATDFFLRVADGEVELDLEAAGEAHTEREAEAA